MIANRIATYTEIKEMSLDDFLNAYEICMVNIYNKNKQVEKTNESSSYKSESK